MIDEELLLAHTVYSNKGICALLLGSGLSRNAGIPTGWEIMVELIKRLALVKKEVILTTPEDWYIQKFKSPPNYSAIIEILAPTREERLNLLKPFFEASSDEISQGIKQPTLGHKNIAKLVQTGYIKVIITTNFDRLLENALRELSIEATIISNPLHWENVMPLIHSPITIIKINGDYLDTKFLNIESELSTYDSRLIEQLKFIFENFGLIVSGWSAKWDVALKQILQDSNKYRFSSFFTYLETPETELAELSKLRNGKLIKIKNADVFFSELAENIEALETGEKNNPISKPIALARLKKYIVKDDLRIHLYELLKSQMEIDYQFINNQPLPLPTFESVKAKIDFAISRMDLLSALLIEGIHWGSSIHYDLWINTISKFAHPLKQNTSYAIYSGLAYFPSLLLFYAAGLTAVFKQNFSFLQKLFSITIFNPYNEGERVNILTNVNPNTIMELEQLRKVLGNRQHVPMSELIYNTLKPYFDNRVTDDKEYDEIFDHFELLLGLQYIHKIGKEWFPKGRYIYRRRPTNNIVNSKLVELKNERDNHVWIKSGLFNNSNQAMDYYNFFIQEINSYHLM